MLAGICRVITVPGVAAVTSAAVPQAIRSSDQPGRERQRFFEPLAPRARPGARRSLYAAAISSPTMGSTSPPNARPTFARWNAPYCWPC